MKWLLILFGILANGAASGLVKAAGPLDLGAPLQLALNWRLLAAITCYFIAFVLYAAAVSRFPLNVAHPITTAGAVVLVGLISAVGFGEGFNRWQIAGYLLLLAGIAALALGRNADG